MGVGLNIEKYSNAMFLPIYVELRNYHLNEISAKPYIFLEAGYALGFINGVSGGNHGGAFGVVGGGFGLASSKQTIFSLEAGFKYQQHKFNNRKEVIIGFTISRNKTE